MRRLRQVVRDLLKVFIHITSFVGKEFAEVIRRPGALFSLILGPFLIMAIFGMGYSGQRRPLDTALVVPQGSGLPSEPAFYEPFTGPAINLVAVTDDMGAAREQLLKQRLDMLVIAPPSIEERFLEGEQSQIRVEYNLTDPVRDNYIRFVADRQVQELNRIILQNLVGEGKEYLIRSAGEDPLAQIPAEVVAAPTRAETINWAPLEPRVVEFFAPAVLALVLQHMAVTLTALSLVRERMSGAIDMFRVAPIHPLELLTGKYLAFGLINLAISALVTALLVLLLGIPLLAQPTSFAAVVLLLTFASLGVGLLISLIADSEQQAVQLSMLVLLASVFLSGFVLPLDEFIPAVQWLAYALPVTHGIRLFQDLMLRGGTNSVIQIWTLAGIGFLMFFLAAQTLRRTLARS